MAMFLVLRTALLPSPSTPGISPNKLSKRLIRDQARSNKIHAHLDESPDDQQCRVPGVVRDGVGSAKRKEGNEAGDEAPTLVSPLPQRTVRRTARLTHFPAKR
jgi:hypothetical protein